MQTFLLCSLCLILITGCKSYPIKTYSIPKEIPLNTSPQFSSPSSRNHFKWVVPKTWIETAPTEMRLAAFSVTDTDLEITLVGLPGGGDLLSNVNRWAGQIQLQPLSEEQLSSVSRPFSHSVWPMMFVRLNGPEKSILAVIFETEGQTYFIKMMGNNSDIVNQVSHFETFVRSIEHAEH